MVGRWTLVPVYHAASRIHGLGAFAGATIQKHEVISTLQGAWRRRNFKDAPSARWRCWLTHYSFRNWRTKVTLLQRGPMKFVNHSCDPNIEWLENDFCIALRRIAKGEELVEDYGRFVAPGYGVRCKCGSRKCTGTIGRK